MFMEVQKVKSRVKWGVNGRRRKRSTSKDNEVHEPCWRKRRFSHSEAIYSIQDKLERHQRKKKHATCWVSRHTLDNKPTWQSHTDVYRGEGAEQEMHE